MEKHQVCSNALIWVRSLPEFEHGPSTRMIEDVETLCIANNYEFRVKDIHTQVDFEYLIEELLNEARDGLRPILHIEMHGNKNDGLLLSSKEYMKYEILNANFRKLNKETSNSLVVVLAACQSFYYLLKSMPNELSPTFLTYAPKTDITIGELEKCILPFYKDLILSNSYNTAYENNLIPHFTEFNCITTFNSFMNDTYNKMGSNKKKKEFINKALDSARNFSRENNLPFDIKKMRHLAKKSFRFDQKMIDETGEKFLGERYNKILLNQIIGQQNNIK